MAVIDIIEKFGHDLVQDIQENLVVKQREKASRYGTPYNPNSNLYNSVKFDISNKSGSLIFQLTMADYYGWVDKGRDAGNVSKEGQKKIQYWIKQKGLNPVKIISEMRMEARSKVGTKGIYKPRKKLTFTKATEALTFLVSRKLKNKGYEGNNFYSDIINDGRLEKLKEDIQNELNEEVEILIDPDKWGTK